MIKYMRYLGLTQLICLAIVLRQRIISENSASSNAEERAMDASPG